MPGDDEVVVRISADVSELKSGAQEGARAVQTMGGQMAEASVGAQKLETGLLRISTHLASHAIPGTQRMARELANLSSEAVGVGPVLAAMIPVAAIVGGVVAMEKMQEAALKDAEGAERVARSTGELNDKIAEEKEKLIGLTQGPLAEAIVKSKDFANMQNEIAKSVKAASEVLEEKRGSWRDWLIDAERVAAFVVSLGPGSAGIPWQTAGGMTTKELETQMHAISELADKNKDYAKALSMVADLKKQVGSIGGRIFGALLEFPLPNITRLFR